MGPALLGILIIIPLLFGFYAQMRVTSAYNKNVRIPSRGHITGREAAQGGYRHETLRFGFGAPVFLATLNFDRAAFYGNHNQEKVVEILRAHGPRVRVEFDQENGLFFLESRSEKLSVEDVVREFGLIRAREYFDAYEREHPLKGG